MPQDNHPTSAESSSPESTHPVSLVFPETPVPNPATWKHVVLSLSPRKQEQIMDGVGRSHSEEFRFSTWSVVGEALSQALLSESAGLYVQSTLKLHRKDFLLFTRTKEAAPEDGTAGGIIEVDFVQRLKNDEWQGHWQEARPTLVHFVRQSLEQFRALEERRKQESP